MHEKEREFENRIKDELCNAVRAVEPSAVCKFRIEDAVNHRDASPGMNGGIQMKKRVLPKVAAIAAVCAVAGSGVAYASGTFTYLIGSSHSYYDYDNYDQVPAAEKEAGFDADIPEAFSNAYTFEGITIADTTEADEAGNTVNAGRELDAGYAKAGMPRVTLMVSKGTFSDEDVANPSAVSKTNGVTVYYDESEYLVVPPDYEVSESDLEREKTDPHFYISYGSEKVETEYMSQAFWEKDGLIYTLLADDGTRISGEELIGMAQEMLK